MARTTVLIAANEFAAKNNLPLEKIEQFGELLLELFVDGQLIYDHLPKNEPRIPQRFSIVPSHGNDTKIKTFIVRDE